MANLDAVIANGTGQTVREDIQNNLQALKGNNNTGTTPTGTSLTSYMGWADTNAGQYKIHNGSSFFPISDISSTTGYAGTHIAPPGSSTVPGYRFLNSSGTALQSGMGLPANDRIGFFHGGSEKVSIDSTGAVGIGTNAPSDKLTVLGNSTLYQTSTDAILNIKALASGSNKDAYINLVADTTYTTSGLSVKRLQTANGESQLVHRGTGRLHLYAQDAGHIAFTTQSTTRWTINDNGGLFWQEHTGGGSAPISGDILARCIISRRGIAANAAVANPYNFYWDTDHLECWIDGSEVGNVSGPTSDYRIKTNVELQTESGIDKVKKLKPITYEIKDYGPYKATGEKREGFLAHEVQEAIPSGATGTKDGERIQSLRVDALVSVLTKALQEAVAKIETLETKVAALEAS